MRSVFVLSISILTWVTAGVLAATRTSPPSGALVVKPDATSGQYKTISAAIKALDDSSSASIFVYPGTYKEQVYITRSGPLKVRIRKLSVHLCSHSS